MKLESITPNKDNPRIIKDDKFKKLVESIKNFPSMLELRPIVVDKAMVILGGNMRYRALQELKYTDIPDNWIKIADKLTDEEKRRFIIEDNMPFGEWDYDVLANNFDVDELLEWGFSEDDLKIEKEIEEDEVPEVTSEPAISQLGEVYQLGRHRLMCGDATKIEDVEKLMDGQKADLVVTDPPYNTGMHKKTNTFNYDWSNKKNGSTRLSHMFNDNLTPEQFNALITNSLENMFTVTKGECVFYIFIDWRNVGYIKQKLEQLMSVKNVIVWDKVVHGLGSDYKFTYEMVVVGKKGNPEINNRIAQEYQDIWRYQREIGRNEDHATAKPIGILTKPINNASKQDDIVLDLFGGSGSTLIAAEQTNRTCYMMELDPKYCDVIRKRYAKFIDKEDQWQEIT